MRVSTWSASGHAAAKASLVASWRLAPSCSRRYSASLSTAASRARVCSDEYTVGSFSSYLGTGGRIALSIPANRSHEASLACLFDTVRSAHFLPRRAS